MAKLKTGERVKTLETCRGEAKSGFSEKTYTILEYIPKTSKSEWASSYLAKDDIGNEVHLTDGFVYSLNEIEFLHLEAEIQDVNSKEKFFRDRQTQFYSLLGRIARNRP